MFQKTRLRLTFLNSLVFIIIIMLLSRTIYFYTETQVYRDIDQSLMRADQRMNKPPSGEFLLGPGPSVIVWGPDQTIIEPRLRDDNFFKVNEAKLFPHDFNKIEAIEVEGATFVRYPHRWIRMLGRLRCNLFEASMQNEPSFDQLFLILLIGGGLRKFRSDCGRLFFSRKGTHSN